MIFQKMVYTVKQTKGAKMNKIGIYYERDAYIYLQVPCKQNDSLHNLFHFYHDECRNLDEDYDCQDTGWANHQQKK